jgi:HK97 family phage portal protein
MIAELLASPFRSERVARFLNATPENPTFDLNSPDAWDLFVGGSQSAAGVVVSHQGSLAIAAVWQAVSLISGDVCKLPLCPYKRVGDDDRVIDTGHPGYFAACKRANPNKSARQLWRDLMVHALLWGNGYAYVSRRGNSIELYNLLPDRTAPEWVTIPDSSAPEGKRSELIYVTEVNGELKTFLPSQIIHVKGISFDGTAGADLVKFARNAWGLNLARQNFESKFFKNGARMGGVLEVPSVMTKKAKDELSDGWDKAYGSGDNPFKVVILREGAKFHAGQVSPHDSELTESKDSDRREVASFFNLPPSKLGVRGSVSYNSFEQDNLSYLYGCLDHWLGAIDDECDMKLLTEQEIRSDTHYFEHNVSKFTRVDYKTQNEVLEIQRRNEVINANEWRKKLNMPPRKDPGGETYINPNTKPAPPAGQSDSPPPPKKDAKAHRDLIQDSITRAAKRVGHYARQEAKNPGKFLAWLDQDLWKDRQEFVNSVRPAIAAYASAFEKDATTLCKEADESFFGRLTAELKARTEAPFIAAELAVNVDLCMGHFERTQPADLSRQLTKE